MPVLRRCLRPASQSSQDMTSFIGMEGTPDKESRGFRFDELSDIWFIFVCWQFSNPQHFIPVDFDFLLQAGVDKFAPKEKLLEVVGGAGMLGQP
jgi:hypothetical protein